jgi:hypothetical protein
MPIDASIPLQARGVQLASPAEQLNMMSSAAQLSEYQRGIGEQNALRDLMSSGVDIKSPEALKQMYAISPSMGMRFEKEQAGINKTAMEGKKLRLDVDQKKMDIQREKFGNLVFNPSNANITAHIEDSVLTGDVPAQQAQALLAQVMPLNLEQRKQFFTEMGVKNEVRYQAATTKRGQDMSASTARRGQDMSASTAQRGQDITSRGQDMSAATAANSLAFQQQQAQNPEQQLVQDPQGNYFAVNRRTGQAMPVTNNALLQPPPVDGDAGAVATPTQLRGKPTTPPFESAYSQTVGKSVAEKQVGQVQAAESAVDNILKLNDTLTQLKDSDAITGFGAELFKNVERVKAQFLNDKAAGKKVTDTEVLDAMLGSDVFPMIQSLGIGARGLDTINEREYLRSVMTGTITMNKDALIELTEIRRNIAERAINKYNEKVDKGEFNKYFKAQGVAPRRIEMPGGGAGSAGGAPIEATNGKDVIVSFDGGKTWKPKGEK